MIPFSSLTSPRERRAIEERGAGLAQPPRTAAAATKRAPEPPRQRDNIGTPPPPAIRTALPRVSKPRPAAQDQQAFHFTDESEPAALPTPVIGCDDLAAPPIVRLRAALVDLLCTATAVSLALAPVFFWARPLALDRWSLAWMASIVVAVVLAYPLIWIICGCGSIGARAMRLTLISFDGTRPSLAARYRRLLATFISVSAAGVGVLWALCDEDHLTWHDHMSGTFPTILNE